jgi:DNA-binding MarR family transcriptional regulator
VALSPENCSCSALRQAARHLSRLYDEALVASGLSLNQYSILSKLDRFGPKTQQELADLLVMERSTLGHLLRPLEKRGLITIKSSKTDGRQKIISLGASGRKVFGAAKPLWALAEARFERAFGQTEAVGMRALMRQVTSIDLQTA